MAPPSSWRAYSNRWHIENRVLAITTYGSTVRAPRRTRRSSSAAHRSRAPRRCSAVIVPADVCTFRPVFPAPTLAVAPHVIIHVQPFAHVFAASVHWQGFPEQRLLDHKDSFQKLIRPIVIGEWVTTTGKPYVRCQRARGVDPPCSLNSELGAYWVLSVKDPWAPSVPKLRVVETCTSRNWCALSGCMLIPVRSDCVSSGTCRPVRLH